MGRDRGEGLPRFKADSRPPTNQPCSYNLGYTRQDVYACSKCAKTDAQGKRILAGFCVGCKTTCHADHLDSVIDLYSKRYFRCDCGNERIRNSCSLQSQKASCNPENVRTYNHNFIGQYCRCDRGYDTRLGDMLQCAMCEDWFHEVCLRMPDGLPAVHGGSRLANITCELVCDACSRNAPFLGCYYATMGLFQPGALLEATRQPVQSTLCLRPPPAPTPLRGRDLLFPAGFRLRLCRCEKCAAEYARLNVSYLVDRRDFVNLAGIDDDDLLVNAPAPDDVLRDAVAKSRHERKPRKRAANGAPVPMDVDVDEDEDEDDADYDRRGSSGRKSRGRRQRVPLPVVQLTEQEREHIRSNVSSFVNRALGGERTPNEQELKQYLMKLRTDILDSHK